MRKDAVIAFAMRHRKLMVAGSGWSLIPSTQDPKGRASVAIVSAWLKQIRRFARARFNLAEACIEGSRWAKIDVRERVLNIAGLGPRKWLVPVALRDVPKWRFRQYPVDGPTTTRKIETGFYDSRRIGGVLDKAFEQQAAQEKLPALSPSTDERHQAPPGNLPTTQTMTLLEQHRGWVWQIYRPYQTRWEEFNRDAFIRHLYDDNEEHVGYGGGLAEELYYYWMSKTKVFTDGLQFIEKWCMGIIDAAVEGFRDGTVSGAAASSAKARAQDILDSIRIMRKHNTIVHDKRDTWQVVQPPAEGWTIIREMLAYLDGAMRVLLLGASLPTEAEVEGGAFAMAKVQEGTTATVIAYDRTNLEETLDDDLIDTIWRMNFAQLVQLGVADDTTVPPKIKITDEKKHDPNIRMEVATKFLQAGGRIIKRELYEQAGFTPPMETDECFEQKAPAPVQLPEIPRERLPVGEGKTSVAEEPHGFGAHIDDDFSELASDVAEADRKMALAAR